MNSSALWGQKVRKFADLAYCMPITLPTFKCMKVKDLPTLPTFNAHARIRVKYFVVIAFELKKFTYVREYTVGKVGKVGKSFKNKQLIQWIRSASKSAGSAIKKEQWKQGKGR